MLARAIVKSRGLTESVGMVLDRRGQSIFEKDMDQVRADEEQAIIFLAKVISKKAKVQIKKEIEANPRLEGMTLIPLGLKTRNALRGGGFFYLPETMDLIWVSWLRKAVYLPENKVILTDSIKERIKKYRASVRRPPLRPKLDPSEVASIKERLEKRHNVKLPKAEVRYSDNIKSAFCVKAIKFPRHVSKERKEKFEVSRSVCLKLKGLKDDETKGVDPHKFTIFLPRRYSNYPAGLYGALWHEFGHVLACALDIRDKTHSEGVAYACGFRGLLLEATEGKFPVEKAIDEIERHIKGAEGSFPFFPHHTALRVIKKYNVERGCFEDLDFRNRDPDEFIAELDESIQCAEKDDKVIREIVGKRQLARIEKPFVGILAIVIVILLILSLVNHLI